MAVDGKLMDCLPSEGVILLAGGLGSGKSCLAYGILEEIHKADPSRALFSYNFPPEKADLLPDYIEVTYEAEFPDGALVIADEAYFAFYAKDHGNELNRFMDQFTGLARQKGILTLFITQATRKVTLATVTGTQVMLIKKPDVMMVKFDRGEMRETLRTAQAEFRKLTPTDRRQATYVISDDFEGIMQRTNTPPAFWGDDLSRAWEGVSLTSDPAQVSSGGACKMASKDTRCAGGPVYLNSLCQPCWERVTLRKQRVRGFKKEMGIRS